MEIVLHALNGVLTIMLMMVGTASRGITLCMSPFTSISYRSFSDSLELMRYRPFGILLKF